MMVLECGASSPKAPNLMLQNHAMIMLEELGVLQRKRSSYVQESNLQNLEHRSTTEHEFCDTCMLIHRTLHNFCAVHHMHFPLLFLTT
jgi:hypothetical protein